MENPCIPHQSRNGTAPQLYQLLSEKSSIHCTYCQLQVHVCLTCYTAVWIKNHSKSTSAIEAGTMKNTDDPCYKKKPLHATKLTLFAVSKDEWGTKLMRILASRWGMHCTYCGMPKGTFWTETMSSRENPVTVIKLRLSEGINQSITYLLSRKYTTCL